MPTQEKRAHIVEERNYSVLVRFFREDGFDGWVAHVLSLDLVTHGKTLYEAIEMARDVSAMMIADDLNANLDPLDRSLPASELAEAFQAKYMVTLNELLDNEADYSAAVLGIDVAVARVMENDKESLAALPRANPAHAFSADRRVA